MQSQQYPIIHPSQTRQVHTGKLPLREPACRRSFEQNQNYLPQGQDAGCTLLLINLADPALPKQNAIPAASRY